MADKFDKFRKEFGADVIDDLLAKLGMGPKYIPAQPKRYDCPKCKGHEAKIKEAHADTDMNCMELVCPCGYREER